MKILVVDDEQDVQLLFLQRFRKEIRRKEYDFVFTFSGEEALVYLNKNKHEAVLILSDIHSEPKIKSYVEAWKKGHK